MKNNVIQFPVRSIKKPGPWKCLLLISIVATVFFVTRKCNAGGEQWQVNQTNAVPYYTPWIVTAQQTYAYGVSSRADQITQGPASLDFAQIASWRLPMPKQYELNTPIRQIHNNSQLPYSVPIYLRVTAYKW